MASQDGQPTLVLESPEPAAGPPTGPVGLEAAAGPPTLEAAVAPPETGEHKCCVSCGLLAAVPQAGACQSCRTVDKQRQRHGLSWPADLSAEEKLAFYQQVAEQRRQSPDSRLKWETVEAAYKETLRRFQRRTTRSSRGGPFLPMEVWLRRGFTEEQVKKGNYEEHPQLGPTYQLEIHDDQGISHEEGHEAARQLDRVDHATQKSGSKRKALDAAEPQLAVPAAGPQKKQDTDEPGKGHAQAERVAAQQQAASRKFLAAATKHLGPAEQTLARLRRAVGAAGARDPADSVAMTGAHSAVQSLERFVEQAKACVARSARNEPTRAEELDLALIQQLKPAAEFAKTGPRRRSRRPSVLRRPRPRPKPQTRTRRQSERRQDRPPGSRRSGWAAGFWRTTAVYTAAGPRSPCLSASFVHLRAAAGPLVLAVHATPSGKSCACALPARSVHLHRHICAVYRAYIYIYMCVYLYT